MVVSVLHQDSRGYTLIESLIAMSLFLAVVIPLGAAIGHLMLDQHSTHLNDAMQLAQSELSYVEAMQEFTDRVSESEHGLIVERKIIRHGVSVEVAVTVVAHNNQGKPLASLSRNFLVYK
jgi:prepilin-type N-terminal cleavage/methylation domain-containing protein